jgi:DNA-directed RNA polymerase specialized sigma24 family protein
MAKDRDLTQEAFDRLLDWLDADRETAGGKYAMIQLRLIRFFASRGCVDAEKLADDTINVVASKVEELSDYEGDRTLYFYGVAQNIYLEDLRKNRRREASEYLTQNQSTESVSESALSNDMEEDDARLERCLKRLMQQDRWLVVEYHRNEKRAKIEHRTRLALELGMTLNALRIKVYRLRLQLRNCIEQLLAEIPAH